MDNKAMDTKPREAIEFTNYADGVAIISAPFYLRAVSSRLGHRKRYPLNGRAEDTGISEISIDEGSCPFNLSCSLQDTDDRLLSFRFAIALSIPHFGGEFNYHDSRVWIRCVSFDKFVDSLHKLADANVGQAMLSDMSDYLTITIANTNGDYTAEFNIRQRDVNYPTSKLITVCKLDRETTQYVHSQFNQMPRWW